MLFGRSEFQRVSSDGYEAMRSNSEVIERDGHGDKVLRLANGQYCKLFRIKHLISMSRIYNPALRFRNNVLRLTKLGIPTVKVQALWVLPEMARWAVIYDPLPGTPLRGLPLEQQQALIPELAKFIAGLHKLGVYFRSLHPGNIVLTPDHQLGLIDVQDCYFYWRLGARHIKRNFRHFFRYAHSKPLREPLLAAYCDIANVSTRTKKIIGRV